MFRKVFALIALVAADDRMFDAIGDVIAQNLLFGATPFGLEPQGYVAWMYQGGGNESTHRGPVLSENEATTFVCDIRDGRATFSVAPGLPARPGTRTGVPGLFLAGDWIDTGLPAPIESAVMSGHLAAAAVLQHLAR